jgi:branched-chain amino acid transport system ATP-binding protein
MNLPQAWGLMKAAWWKYYKQIRDTGVTIILISHDMKLVMENSDRVSVLNFGEKIFEGHPEAMKDNRGLWRHILEQNSLLKINNISSFYGPICAIRDISMEIYTNEIVGLIGANGAGKSSLMKSIIGIRPFKNGNIVFMDHDITRASTPDIVSSGIAYVPEGGGVFPFMTIKENLQLGAVHYKGNVNERIAMIYERFPLLKERERQQAGTLSGGQRQLVAIGRALMSAPRLLMLDEPSLGLAPKVVEELFRLILDLKNDGYTILLSEQNAKKTLQYANRAYVFRQAV